MNTGNPIQSDIIDVKSERLSSETYTSFSRLEAYKKCSEYYHLKYREKIKEERSFNKYLEIGALVHAVLEDYLLGKDTIENSFYLHLGAWLKKHGLSFDAEEIVPAIEPAAELLWRASRKCDSEEEKIRKANGDLLIDPIAYPSRDFKRLCYKAGVTARFSELDLSVQKQAPYFLEESFSWILAKSLYFVKYFNIPNWIEKTIAVELPISTNTENNIKLPLSETYLQGYIDWIVKSKDGKTIILDHKTSKKKPSVEEVFLNPQLNLYVWLYRELYGIQVDCIGINHLESGEMVIVDTNKKVFESVLSYHVQLQKAIETGVHFKHDPLSYNSPCFKRDWKTNRVKETCPYLSLCHPIFNQIIQNELDS